MLTYPKIDPVALQLGPATIHWYGVMYLVGFFAAWLLGRRRAASYDFSDSDLTDLIFYAALGVILGGRLGFMLIYNFPEFIRAPWQLFMIWQGGMSFHGGLIGVLASLYLFARKIHKPYLVVMDFTAPLVPIGLAAGRLGNFINGELWGRVTDVPWAMIFPEAGPWPRHPSQLYEFTLEGIVLFVVLWIFSAKKRTPGAVSALFLIAYSSFRFILEFFRMPDPQMGFYFGWLSMGQLLSLPMLLLGAGLIAYIHKEHSS